VFVVDLFGERRHIYRRSYAGRPTDASTHSTDKFDDRREIYTNARIVLARVKVLRESQLAHRFVVVRLDNVKYSGRFGNRAFSPVIRIYPAFRNRSSQHTPLRTNVRNNGGNNELCTRRR